MTGRRFPPELALLLVLGISAVVVGILVLSDSSITEQRNLINRLSEFRVDGQRFFRASPRAFDPERYQTTLREAEVFLLTSRDSAATSRVRALLAVGSARLRDAADILEKLEADESGELLNDLGVVYWGLGQQNPSNYFKALRAFERSAQLAPRAPAPRFNAARAFRQVGMLALADSALNDFQRVEEESFWKDQLSLGFKEQQPSIDALRQRLDRDDAAGARALLEADLSTYKRLALDYVLNPPEARVSDPAIQFVLNYFAVTRGDETVKAIVAPLGTPSERDVLNARRLVHLGTVAYFQSKPQDSLQFYDLAQNAMRGTGSRFDALWLKLKRADTLLRSARTDVVGGRLDNERIQKLLDEVIADSRELKFDWLLGQALASKSMASMTTSNQDEILPLMREAVDTLTATQAAQEAARPLYYLAVIHFVAGDFETSLSMIYRSLHLAQTKDRLAQTDELVRLTQLYFLSGIELNRMGFERYGLAMEQQAITQALAAQNYGLVASNATFLGMIYLEHGDYASAQSYLKQAGAARDRIVSPSEQASADLGLNLLCGQLSIVSENLKRGEECLTRAMAILKPQPKPAPDFFAQTLLQLAQIHTLRGEFGLARQEFRQATEVIEQNDAYMASSALRMPFENQRRSVYNAAIGFEYDHDGKDAAWNYTQQYRSKLFLEFMRQMNPGLVLEQAIDRNRVQQVIPDNVQVVEYVMLNDRLLIWLVSRDKFLTVAVPITRSDLENRVTDLVERINSKGMVRPQLAGLYKVLIEPIQSELDPKRALAIIPDQALHRLNFPALYSPATQSFLIQRYTILESPNLTTLLSGASGSPARGPAVTFGALKDNTGATSELRALGRFYPDARSFNGEAALKPAFLSSLGTAGVFHFAGHSQDAADPLRSSVLLDGDREGANSVTAVDISRRKMPGNSVVVLASCDSSVGNSRDGIGIRGLTSAFLISGAGSVVGSLWLVDAESTSRLVLDFHKGFAAEHLPVATALRNAQLRFIQEGAHPYYWSGFVVTGNTSALR